MRVTVARSYYVCPRFSLSRTLLPQKSYFFSKGQHRVDANQLASRYLSSKRRARRAPRRARRAGAPRGGSGLMRRRRAYGPSESRWSPPSTPPATSGESPGRYRPFIEEFALFLKTSCRSSLMVDRSKAPLERIAIYPRPKVLRRQLHELQGAELSDVSLLQRMPNVEVLALRYASHPRRPTRALARRPDHILNKIRTLSDFAHLSRLRELYVRKNEVGALSEVRHLRRLPLLTALWLEENPCAARADYRHTVLRNLPQLTRLDDRPVLPDELEEAQRRGVLYAHDDDEPDEEPERDDWRPPTPDGEPRRLHDPVPAPLAPNTNSHSSH
ncbi:Uncharacterized protein F09G8.5 [Eumeta japonica]|uniref:Uncharacterized protein F09G8.5 n=1 Tax=Eumeta variegata TaxID=151549 RepID=A0A4C1YVJ8_EUMVA|nr:Uncharacterized protein F09G8.5 [Eumeta japonica]